MSANLRLKVTTGEAAGRELLVADELVIGREADGEGQITDDPEISRQHARIARAPDGGWGVEDLGSRNGTFVNGHRIERQELLAAGDAIEVGATRIVVQVSSPAAAPEAASPAPAPEAEPESGQALGATVVGGAVPPSPLAADEPTEVAEPEPQPEPAPPVSVMLELDPAAGEATISLGPGSDRVRFVFEDGGWRLRPEA